MRKVILPAKACGLLTCMFAGLYANDLGHFSKVKSTFKEQSFVSFVNASKNRAQFKRQFLMITYKTEVYGIRNGFLLKRVVTWLYKLCFVHKISHIPL